MLFSKLDRIYEFHLSDENERPFFSIDGSYFFLLFFEYDDGCWMFT